MEKKTQDEIANIRRQYQNDSKGIRESLNNLSKGKETAEEMERKEQLKVFFRRGGHDLGLGTKDKDFSFIR